MRGTNNSSAGNKYEPELVDFPGLLPSHCSTQAQFSRRTEVPRFFAWCFPISLPDVSRFLRLMFPDFLPNASWFLYLKCIPIAWCSLVSFSDVSQFLGLMFPDFLALYLPMSLPNISLSFPCGPLNFLSLFFLQFKLWVRDFHLKINFYPVFSTPIHLKFWANNSPSMLALLLGYNIVPEERGIIRQNMEQRDNFIRAAQCRDKVWQPEEGQCRDSNVIMRRIDRPTPKWWPCDRRKLLTNNFSLSKYFNRLKSNNFLSHIASLGIHLVHLVCWSRRRPLKTNLKPETLG